MNRSLGALLLLSCVFAGCTESIDDEPLHLGVASSPLKPGVPGVPSPFDVPATKVRTHGMHACAMSPAPNKQISCWGSNAYGELGRGYADNAAHPYAGVASVAPSPVLDIGVSGSAYATFAIRPADGLIQGWGSNAGSKLGGGAIVGSFSVMAQTIPSLINAKEVAWGRYNACALVDEDGDDSTWRDRSVYCWGLAAFGNLGDGINGSGHVTTPKRVQLGAYVNTIAGNESGFCAVIGGGDVWCWGAGFYSDEPATRPNLSWAPRQVLLLPSTALRSLSVGDGDGCVITTTDEVWCWRKSTQDVSFMVAGRELAEGVRSIAVATSGTHKCAVLVDQTVTCWGSNQFGELGNGVTTASLPPVKVTGLGGVTDISASRYTTCAVAGGFAYCWGRNDLGQVGNGTTSAARTTPAKVQFPQLVLP